MNKVSKIDLSYIAGIIDGEGTIFVQRVKTRNSKMSNRGFHYRSGLAVNMTDRPLVLWLKNITGVGRLSGVRRHNPNHKPGHRWSVWSKEAKILLLKLVPYLKLKKHHAKNLIAFQSTMKIVGSKGVTDSDWQQREQYRQISLKLNKKGI